MALDAHEHGVLVQNEGGLHPGDLLQGVLERRPRVLGELQGLCQHRRVVRVERPAVPWAMTMGVQHLLQEELPAAPLARSLDLHAVSFSRSRSTTRSASSKGSTGFTNHASAPDHSASQASWGRSSRITMTPVYGCICPRSSLARAKAPAREAISSATITS